METSSSPATASEANRAMVFTASPSAVKSEICRLDPKLNRPDFSGDSEVPCNSTKGASMDGGGVDATAPRHLTDRTRALPPGRERFVGVALEDGAIHGLDACVELHAAVAVLQVQRQTHQPRLDELGEGDVAPGRAVARWGNRNRSTWLIACRLGGAAGWTNSMLGAVTTGKSNVMRRRPRLARTSAAVSAGT